MIDDIPVKHREVIREIYANDYYVDIFEWVCESFGGQGGAFALQDLVKINSLWNNFWYELPDDLAIQRDPFFKICDLAEGDYFNEEHYNV